VLVADIIGSAGMQRLAAAALARRVVVVGDGATMPEPSIRPAANLRVPVRPGPSTATDCARPSPVTAAPKTAFSAARLSCATNANR
jgi:hypothetical protein